MKQINSVLLLILPLLKKEKKEKMRGENETTWEKKKKEKRKKERSKNGSRVDKRARVRRNGGSKWRRGKRGSGKSGVKEKAPGIVPIHDVNAESVLKNDETMVALQRLWFSFSTALRATLDAPTFDVSRSTSVHAPIVRIAKLHDGL